MELVQKVQEAIESDYWLAKTTKVCCIDKLFCIQFGFAYLNIEIHICLWCQLFIFIASTAFFTLADGTNHAGPVGFSSIYQLKSHLKIIFPLEKYFDVYVCILYFNCGDIFSLLL